MTPHDPSATSACAWRGRLDDYFAERMRMPHEWGINDCCMFAADAVRAMEGVDHAAAERGTYNDAAGANTLLEHLGGLAAIGARAGVEIAPLQAQDGDVGLVTSGDRQLLAICSGPYWLAPTKGGLAPFELRAASIAWRVAHG